MLEPETDATAAWSLKTLCAALRKTFDGLPEVSEDTIRTVLLENGYSWQQSQTWCETGTAIRKRKHGNVTVTDPETAPKKLNRTRLSDGRKSGSGALE